MFTGIVEEVGKIVKIGENELNISCKEILNGTKIGDSISVNGVCLTVKDIKRENFTADISFETIKRSNFSKLKSGDFVNLERSLKVSDRISGHIVQGHVDTTGNILEIERFSQFYELTISYPQEYSDLVVEKGSICVNGISLTISNCETSIFKVAIIPHTFSNTNLKFGKVGDVVNIEFDIIGKYIISYLKSGKFSTEEKITLQKLKEKGF